MLWLSFAGSIFADATFVVKPDPDNLPPAKYVASLAFRTSSEALIAEIRAKIANGETVSPRFRIAAGADGINRNYLAANAPVWDWHVTEGVALNLYWAPEADYGLPLQDISKVGPERYIALSGATISPRFLKRVFEVAPDDVGRVVNVSTRGVLGAGNKVLIAGFIVQGTSPRLVLMRAMGPSLSNFGVDGAATDPSARLYRGSTSIGFNDDWQPGPNTDLIPVGYAPGNDKESAIVAILEPGLYTVHGSSADQGIGLIDVYDLSGLK